MTGTGARERVFVSVKGVVQGVGFRPFVYQLATRHNLHGWVCNTSEDVRMEVEGEPGAIGHFLEELETQAPPRALIQEINARRLAMVGITRYDGFEIRPSLAETGRYQLISPDIATCPECLRELFDPEDRRYGYPFTNCTNCGPRFTIIEDIPYDRARTTMRHFKMCPTCQQEYDNPLSRRFHAQPNACPACGPTLRLWDGAGEPVPAGDVVAATSRLLQSGSIVAVKGLGGFLLACDATNEDTVKALRRRKNRPSKPLAIMVASMEEASHCCFIDAEEAELLKSPAAPIVLLRRREGSSISRAVAPGLQYLGLMLPYTPLHHLLLKGTGVPLVMTSGNTSEEPIVRDNDEAVRRLAGIADYFLVHDRDIYARYDDSVSMVERGAPQVVRRARSCAPYPIRLGFKSRKILACGAELKNTFCATRDEYAFLSQHIGDMENLETFEHFQQTAALYQKLFRIEPEIVACDLHPDYLATRYATELAGATAGLKLVPVQHHYAHIVSGMADNGRSSRVIGVAFDGTGYGADGNIWGGEFLLSDYHGYERVCHLAYLPLAGGDLAVRKPYRAALGYLLALFGEAGIQGLPFAEGIDGVERGVIVKQIQNRINAPLTSSCGRLFDAVAALIGVRGEVTYEAQAAVELESVALAAAAEDKSYPFSLDTSLAVYQIRLDDLFASLVSDLRGGIAKAVMAARFHNSVARMISETCQRLAGSTGIQQVVLSGGVFQNRLLLRKAVVLLEAANLEVLTHRQVPCNDGGVALGQAVVANFAA